MSTAAAKYVSGVRKDDIGEIEPVKPADSSVIEIGKFAVAKHNVGLHFVAVVGGFQWSIPGGTHYALIIETQDDNGATYLHKALVLEIIAVPRNLELVWYKN